MNTKKENKEITEEIIMVRRRMVHIEKARRRNNIVIKRLEVDSCDVKTLIEGMKNFINEKLEVKVEVESAFKLGQKTRLVNMGESPGQIGGNEE